MPPLARLNRKIQNKIQVNSIIQKSLRRNGNTGQDFAPLARKIGGLDSVPAPTPDVEVSTNWNCSKSSRLHLLALRTRSLPRSKFLQNFCLTISFSGIFCSSDFLMIEIIHDRRMSLRDSAIRHFIIHKGTIILLSHFRSFYFKRFQSNCGYAIIDLIVKASTRSRIFSADIIHGIFLKPPRRLRFSGQKPDRTDLYRSRWLQSP